MAEDFVLALTTCKSEKEVDAIVDAVLKKKLAACCNVLYNVRSKFWWKNKIEEETEAIILMKTKASKVEALKKEVLIKHSYKLPEFIVLPITAGSASYLDWVAKETR